MQPPSDTSLYNIMSEIQWLPCLILDVFRLKKASLLLTILTAERFAHMQSIPVANESAKYDETTGNIVDYTVFSPGRSNSRFDRYQSG